MADTVRRTFRSLNDIDSLLGGGGRINRRRLVAGGRLLFCIIRARVLCSAFCRVGHYSTLFALGISRRLVVGVCFCFGRKNISQKPSTSD